ncbi:MAG: hypothetical protein WC444_04085 [Candidatus Paceibacterota bacterium]
MAEKKTPQGEVSSQVSGISQEKIKEIPYGDPKCRICKLPVEDIIRIHKLKFEEEYSYKKIRQFLKDNYGIGNGYNYLTDHFLRHTDKRTQKLVERKKQEILKPEILEVLEPVARIGSENGEKIEKAFNKMVGLVSKFVDHIEVAANHLNKKLSEMDVEDDKFIEGLDYTNTLNLMNHILRSAREQIKEISALRAPKVMVMQFLSDAVDRSIFEINGVMADLFRNVQTEVTRVTKTAGFDLDQKVLIDVMSKAASDYKNRILEVRRDNIKRAQRALEELEDLF